MKNLLNLVNVAGFYILMNLQIKSFLKKFQKRRKNHKISNMLAISTLQLIKAANKF